MISPKEGIPNGSELEIRSLIPKVNRAVGLFFWLLVGACLIAFGFAIDGASEVGHHLGLIVGGGVVGVGTYRTWRS